MPLALAMSYVKAAIPVLASISERRLNKLVDPATNDGLPAFLIGNEDGTDSGFMIVQYTAAALVNDLATRAHPASVYSMPTSANAEDHVSMGANEARHVLEMTEDLGSRDRAGAVYRCAGARLSARTCSTRRAGSRPAAIGRHSPARSPMHRAKAIRTMRSSSPKCRSSPARCANVGDFHAGSAVRKAHDALRRHIGFMARDRAMDGDVRSVCELVRDRVFARR